mgnify:FL=1
MADRKLPRGVTIRRGKNSESLQIAFTYRSIQCRESLHMPATAGNIRYADRLRNEVLAEIERDTFNYQKKFPESKTAARFGFNTSKPLMRELLEQARKVKASQIKSSSMKAYDSSLDTHLIPVFGHLRVDHVTPKMIRDWFIDSGLSAKSIRNHRVMLDFALSTAVQDGIIPRNPLDGIKLNHILPRAKQKSSYEPDPLDMSEIQKMIEAADPWYRPMIITWFYTGMRPGELIALTWEDINHEDCFIDVNKAHVLGNEQTPKTDTSVRMIDMLPIVIDALKEQKKLTFFINGEKGHVFRFKKSNKPFMDHRALTRYVWKPTINNARIRYRNQYQARHTFASQMLTEGEDIWWIAQQMGHKGVDMINRVYGKWIRNNQGKQYKPKNDWSGFGEHTIDGRNK